MFWEKSSWDIMKEVNYSIRTFKDVLSEKEFESFVMGGDVGGTNTNIGIAGIKELKPVILFSLDFKSQELNSLIPAINKTIAYVDKKYNLKIDSACFGVAGIAYPKQDFIELTNVDWNISKKNIIDKTQLGNVAIINDFQAVGYGFNLLDHNNNLDIYKIRKETGQEPVFSNKAILGAGTGLGKSILIYDKHSNIFIPNPSEGGHEDFPAQNDFEIDLLDFIKELRCISHPIVYEELLSGRGIESIYLYLKKIKKFDPSKYTEEIDNSNDKIKLISKYRKIEATCKETFKLFTRYYARCAKNFVLDTMAVGGLYIAGGIAEKNKEIFKSSEFLNGFENAYRRSDLLKNIPIYIIVNYDVSLFGACLAAMYHFEKKICDQYEK
jgi:glucokinase